MKQVPGRKGSGGQMGAHGCWHILSTSAATIAAGAGSCGLGQQRQLHQKLLDAEQGPGCLLRRAACSVAGHTGSWVSSAAFALRLRRPREPFRPNARASRASSGTIGRLSFGQAGDAIVGDAPGQNYDPDEELKCA